LFRVWRIVSFRRFTTDSTARTTRRILISFFRKLENGAQREIVERRFEIIIIIIKNAQPLRREAFNVSVSERKYSKYNRAKFNANFLIWIGLTTSKPPTFGREESAERDSNLLWFFFVFRLNNIFVLSRFPSPGKNPSGKKKLFLINGIVVPRRTFNINAGACFSVPNDKDRVVFNWFRTRKPFEFRNICFYYYYYYYYYYCCWSQSGSSV